MPTYQSTRRQRRQLRLRRALRRADRHHRHRQPGGRRRQRPAHHLVPAVRQRGGRRSASSTSPSRPARASTSTSTTTCTFAAPRHARTRRHRRRRLRVQPALPDLERRARRLRPHRQPRLAARGCDPAEGALPRRTTGCRRRRASPARRTATSSSPACSAARSTNTTPTAVRAHGPSSAGGRSHRPQAVLDRHAARHRRRPDGTLYYADIGIISARAAWVRAPTGSLRRITFTDGTPNPPETIADDLLPRRHRHLRTAERPGRASR